MIQSGNPHDNADTPMESPILQNLVIKWMRNATAMVVVLSNLVTRLLGKGMAPFCERGEQTTHAAVLLVIASGLHDEGIESWDRENVSTCLTSWIGEHLKGDVLWNASVVHKFFSKVSYTDIDGKKKKGSKELQKEVLSKHMAAKSEWLSYLRN